MDRRFAIIRIIAGTAALAVLLAAGRFIEGHPILKEGSPAANATVTGPDVTITLKHNVRVDAARSKVQLSHPDDSVTDLPLQQKVSPDRLSSKDFGQAPGAERVCLLCQMFLLIRCRPRPLQRRREPKDPNGRCVQRMVTSQGLLFLLKE